jgi:hypothetical protein
MTTDNDLESRSQTQFLRLPSEDWTKIIASVFTGAMLAVFVFWLNSKAPFLRKTVPETVTFQGAKNQFGLATCSVANDGTKEAEDVVCSFALRSSVTPEIKITPDSLGAKTDIRKDGSIFVHIGTLNPGESFQVSATTTDPTLLPQKLDFSVRGKGVVALESQPSQVGYWVATSIVFVVGFVLGGGAVHGQYRKHFALINERLKGIAASTVERDAQIKQIQGRLGPLMEELERYRAQASGNEAKSVQLSSG